MEQKGFLLLAGIMVSFITSSISVPMLVLALLMLSDYFLGIGDSIKTGKKFDKVFAIWGAIKKLGYAFVVLFAILADLLINQGLNGFGYELHWKAVFSVVVTIYLCGIEFFSGCKHLEALGVPVPKFLIKFGTFLQEKSESIMEEKGNE